MKNKILILVLLFTPLLSIAQQGKINKGNKKFNNYSYIDAIGVYKQVYDKGYASEEVLLKLANAYYLNSDYNESANFFNEAFSKNEDMFSDTDLLRYAVVLRSTDNYEKGNIIIQKFLNKTNNPDYANYFNNNKKNYLDSIQKNTIRYDMENAKFNSEARDYGVAFYTDDEIVYSSTKETNNLIKRTHSWDNQPFTQLYGVTLSDSSQTAKKSGKFSNVLNTKYHESTPTFTKDGLTVYFTRNNFNQGKLGKNKDNTTLLKIYKSNYTEDKGWSEAEELPFNNDNYNTAHPALSPDGKYLYFASDMPGGFGFSDLYRVEILENNQYSQPINLGSKINTPGRETFPFVSDLNELYFASDGHLGLGGLDIFVFNINNYQSYPNKFAVRNIGKIANTEYDDFNFIINTSTQKGYLSSNRLDDNKGLDDIYSFTELETLPKECFQSIKGVISDLNTNAPINEATVQLLDKDHKLITETTTNINGEYTFETADCDTVYFIKASKENYNTEEDMVKTPDTSGETEKDIKLDLTKKPIKPGDDLADILNIPIIYFDLDKWNIRPDAAKELAKVLVVLNEHPNLKIDIRSHTDCRQTYDYNLRLSDRRAKSTRQWLIDNGVSANRLTAKGYGESQLVNDCSCNITDNKCSKEQHQLNRRSEFIIVE